METVEGKKITIFTSEEKRHHHRPLYEAVLEELSRAGIANAAVTRGIAGFGSDRKISTIKIEVLSFNLPIVIEATDTAEKIDRVAPALAQILEGGVLEVMPVRIIRKTTDPSGEDN
jgi:PII-like signaling protein